MAAAPPVETRPGENRGVLDRPTQARAKELFRTASFAYYDRAKEAGMTLSAWLEAQDPSGNYRDGLDAFERQLMMANVRTQGDNHTFFADEMDAWSRSPQHRSLFPEWARRQWNRSRDQWHAERRRRQAARAPAYSATDYAEGTVSRPYVDDARLRYTQIEPAVPLSELIAVTTNIVGNAYRSTRFADVTAQKRYVRVAEGAPIPRVKLSSSDNTLRFGKFGRAIETTYEQVRRQRIDVIALQIMLMSIQAEVDEVAAVIDVIVNGDGNSGTAATSYNLTTLDPSTTANNLTLKGWLAFKQKFPNPYALTTALTQDAGELALRTLNVGSANIPLVALSSQAALGGFTPINDRLADGTRLGVTADAPANSIVGIDSRFAVERVVETGSDISETQRWIENQTELLTFSINEGFGRWQVGAGTAAVLNLAA